MPRPKGAKNKKTIANTETSYRGYFLMDSGLKVSFDILKEQGGEVFQNLYENAEFPFDDNDTIWLGESDEIQLRVKKIIGWYIDEIEITN